MSGWFSVVIAVLFSGVVAVLVISAAYVFCVRPVLSARRHGRGRARGLGAGAARAAEPGRQLVEQPAERDAPLAHQPRHRHEMPADAERWP
ncbi:hypothetical protein GCM10010464_27480 [Pseudonocardia yunnanensis]|uniref:Uncharacterized protein n=1 Tax=Pseudonocardia yunnanensis TaxID=58107 RepID=A0ABW4F486_9PSEU